MTTIRNVGINYFINIPFKTVIVLLRLSRPNIFGRWRKLQSIIKVDADLEYLKADVNDSIMLN